MKVRLLKDIYDDGQDHHPATYVGRKGDTVVIHSIQTAVVSHDGTGHGFVVHDGELEVTAHETPVPLEDDPHPDTLLVPPGARYKLNGYCDKCRRVWIVTCQSGTEVTVKAFHCVCGHVTEMDGRAAQETAVPYCIDCNEAHDPRTCGALKAAACTCPPDNMPYQRAHYPGCPAENGGAGE